MGWLDGFPFISREEARRRESDFQRRVLPFGEAHKAAALAVLQELVPGFTGGSEALLFAFIAMKDKLHLYGTGEEGQRRVLRELAPTQRAGREDLRRILSLALLDMGTQSLDAFPTAAQAEAGLLNVFV